MLINFSWKFHIHSIVSSNYLLTEPLFMTIFTLIGFALGVSSDMHFKSTILTELFETIFTLILKGFSLLGVSSDMPL